MLILDPGSYFFLFGSQIQGRQDPGSASKNLAKFFLTQKTDTMLSKKRSWMFIPDPGSGFFSILDPGSRGQKSPVSRIRNTVDAMEAMLGMYWFCNLQPRAPPRFLFSIFISEGTRRHVCGFRI